MQLSRVADEVTSLARPGLLDAISVETCHHLNRQSLSRLTFCLVIDMRKRFIIPIIIIVGLSLMTIYDLVPYQEQIRTTQSDFVQTQHELYIPYNSSQQFTLNITVETTQPNFPIIDTTVLSLYKNLTIQIFMDNTATLLLYSSYQPGLQYVQDGSVFFIDDISSSYFWGRFYNLDSTENITLQITTVLGYQTTVLFQRPHKFLFSETFNDFIDRTDFHLTTFLFLVIFLTTLNILAYRALKQY
jgi:hypothetical protein